ncbi:hypothetical protein KJ810_03450 [Patescibacteria group bacterium]|nr:hypothetical protein [Patescibacteria group bacterium]
MKRSYLAFLFILTSSALFLPHTVHALSLWDVSSTLGLGSADLQETVIAIIQWILGLLGIVGVIMILYGGFTWLTSGGNEEKIEKAKKIISAAIIGISIVILAWAVISYAVSSLLNFTGM